MQPQARQCRGIRAGAVTYAARFWALRLDCAGVISSSSEFDPCLRLWSSASALVMAMRSGVEPGWWASWPAGACTGSCPGGVGGPGKLAWWPALNWT